MAAATIRNFEMEKLPLVILIAKLRGNLEIFQVTDFLYVEIRSRIFLAPIIRILKPSKNNIIPYLRGYI